MLPISPFKGWSSFQKKLFYKGTGEGYWTNITRLDNIYFSYLLMVLMGFILLSTFVGVDPDLFNASLLYLVLLLVYWNALTSNKNNTQSPGEVIGWGVKSKLKDYFTLSVVLIAVWIGIYYLLAPQVEGQTIIRGVFQSSFIKLQSIEPLRLLSLAGIGIFAVSIAETKFLAGFLLPSITRYRGVVVGVLSTSIIRGLIHYQIFQAVGVDVWMAVIFGFIFYPYCLREKTSSIAIFGHIIANTLAYFPFIYGG